MLARARGEAKVVRMLSWGGGRTGSRWGRFGPLSVRASPQRLRATRGPPSLALDPRLRRRTLLDPPGCTLRVYRTPLGLGTLRGNAKKWKRCAASFCGSGPKRSTHNIPPSACPMLAPSPQPLRQNSRDAPEVVARDADMQMHLRIGAKADSCAPKPLWLSAGGQTGSGAPAPHAANLRRRFPTRACLPTADGQEKPPLRCMLRAGRPRPWTDPKGHRIGHFTAPTPDATESFRECHGCQSFICAMQGV